MKKIFILLIGAALLLLAACGSGSEGNNEETNTSGSNDEPAQEEEAKVIRVGATGQSFPNAYKEGDDLVGYDVEVIEAIAEHLGYELEWTLADFSGIMGQLDSGRLDTVANNVAITDEREEKLYFSDPYSYAGAQIVTHVDNDYDSLEDLEGKTVSAVFGSNNVNNLKKADPEGKIEIRTYETRDGAMNDAVLNRVDGYINTRSALIAEINKLDLPLKMVGDPIVYLGVAYPFKKNDEGKKLQEEFNTAIKELREEGKIKEISEKYYGEDISVKIEE